MNGPNSIAKRVAAAGATGWVAAGLGAGIAETVEAGRSTSGGVASGPTPSAGAGGAGGSGVLTAGVGGAVTAREAAGASVEGGTSRRCRKLSVGRSVPPNQPSPHAASPPSAARSASTIAPIQSRFDFDAPNVGVSNALGSADGSSASLAKLALVTAPDVPLSGSPATASARGPR